MTNSAAIEPQRALTDYATLMSALAQLRRQSTESGVTIGDVLDTLGKAGFCLLALFLALPFLQPFIPLGPFSTAGGFAMIVLGYQLLRNLPEPILPERIRAIPIAAGIFRRVETVAERLLGWLRRYTRPRYPDWISGLKGRRVAGGVMLAGGLIMIIPFFGIPLNDFFPALAIASVCVGELEQDGLMVLVALGWLAVGAIYCAFLITMIALFGWGVFGVF